MQRRAVRRRPLNSSFLAHSHSLTSISTRAAKPKHTLVALVLPLVNQFEYKLDGTHNKYQLSPINPRDGIVL